MDRPFPRPWFGYLCWLHLLVSRVFVQLLTVGNSSIRNNRYGFHLKHGMPIKLMSFTKQDVVLIHLHCTSAAPGTILPQVGEGETRGLVDKHNSFLSTNRKQSVLYYSLTHNQMAQLNNHSSDTCQVGVGWMTACLIRRN